MVEIVSSGRYGAAEQNERKTKIIKESDTRCGNTWLAFGRVESRNDTEGAKRVSKPRNSSNYTRNEWRANVEVSV